MYSFKVSPHLGRKGTQHGWIHGLQLHSHFYGFFKGYNSQGQSQNVASILVLQTISSLKFSADGSTKSDYVCQPGKVRCWSSQGNNTCQKGKKRVIESKYHAFFPKFQLVACKVPDDQTPTAIARILGCNTENKGANISFTNANGNPHVHIFIQLWIARWNKVKFRRLV